MRNDGNHNSHSLPNRDSKNMMESSEGGGFRKERIFSIPEKF